MKKIAKYCTLLILSMFSLAACYVSEKPKHAILTVTYDYGRHCVDQETGEGMITALFNDSYLTFEVVQPDRKLIPGDQLWLEYSGDLSIQTTYPGKISISKGKLISAKYKYAEIIEIEYDSIQRDENNCVTAINNYQVDQEYVILNEANDYLPLANYNGEQLFASKLSGNKQVKTIPSLLPVAALFAFQPRTA